jgi:hypothetical protein
MLALRSSTRSAQRLSGTDMIGPLARVPGCASITSAKVKAFSPQPAVFAAAGAATRQARTRNAERMAHSEGSLSVADRALGGTAYCDLGLRSR